MSSFEVWLTDDAGRPMELMNDLGVYFSYSRTTRGFGVCELGVPFQKYKEVVPDIFQVDWRLDFWRSPGYGFPKRREGSFFLRKYEVYRREDGTEILRMYGRSPIDILRRVPVVDFSSTNEADDMMKEVCQGLPVDTSVGTPEFLVSPFRLVNIGFGDFKYTTGEYTKDSDQSQGPIITQTYTGNALDFIQNIKEITFQMHENDSTNKRIFFDVVEGPGLTGGFGYVFMTFPELRGKDRRNDVIFSVENGNLKDPRYYEDYLDQITYAWTSNEADIESATSPDLYFSRWNRCVMLEKISGVYDELLPRSYRNLEENKAKKGLSCTFLDTPGGPVQPRSLYGVDWDLGDMVTAKFAGKVLDAEVAIVYVSVNEDGQETITGRNEVGVA